VDTNYNPFLTYDKQTVIGELKSAGSKDPDILHARKKTLLSYGRVPKMVGTYLMFLGILLTITILGAILGIPALLFGWWLRKRGVRNLALVEETYAEFVSA
jgi:hypothetical protein